MAAKIQQKLSIVNIKKSLKKSLQNQNHLYTIGIMEFKDRLIKSRKEKGLTQRELAKAVGLTQAAIQSLESGRVQATTHLLEIAKVLGVSPEYLREGKERIQATHDLDVGYINAPILSNGNLLAWVEKGILPSTYGSIKMEVRDHSTLSNRTFCVDLTEDATCKFLFHRLPVMNLHMGVVDPDAVPNLDELVLIKTHKGEIKLRQYAKEGNTYFISSPDPSHPHLRMEEIKILGVVKRILHDEPDRR